jgi:4-carboxymuconolactone decarboxylase
MDEVARHALGMASRREVLGEAYVERAMAASTAFTAEFQDLITRYAWGEIWSRPGLEQVTRRLLTISMLIALGREAELKLHIRAALEHGLPMVMLKEVILQSAIYCGVPAANAAFKMAAEQLSEMEMTPV